MRRSSVLRILLAAAASLVVLLFWFVRFRLSSEPLQPAPDAANKTPPQLASPSSASTEKTPELERAPASAADDASAAARDPVALANTLEGVVLGEQDAAIEGARVDLVLCPAGHSEYLPDFAYAAEESVLASRESDVHGHFAFPVEHARSYDLHVHAKSHADARLQGVGAGPPIEIRLRRGASLRVRVLRQSDRAAVAGARVMLFGDASSLVEVRSDERGEAYFDGLPPGPLYVHAIPEQQSRAAADVELAEGEQRAIDLVVPNGYVVRGTITAQGSGRPIGGAEVSAWDFYAKTTRTDTFGKYTIEGVSAGGVDFTVVSARADGFGRIDRRVALASGHEAVCDLELAPGRLVRGRLVDASGGPVASAYVAAVRVGREADVRGCVATRSSTDGRFELRDLAPSMPHALYVRARGRATTTLDLPNAADDAATVELGDLVLADGACVAGRVHTPDGSVVPGAGITIRHLEAAPLAAARALDHVTSQADANGRFRECELPLGRHELRVESSRGKATLEIELVPGEVRGEIDITLKGGAVLAGRVLDPDGAGVRGATVYVRGAVPVGTEDDGGFRIEGLPEGPIEVEASHHDPIERAGETVWLLPARESGVLPGTTSLVLTLRAGDVIEGRLLAPDGTPLAGGWVEALDESGARVAQDSAREGSFRLIVPAGSRVDLVGSRRVLDAQGRFQTVEMPGQQARSKGVAAGTRGVVLRFVADE